MARRGALVLVLVVAAGVVAVLAAAATTRNDLAFTLGVEPWRPVADVAGGARACQGPIDVPEAFEAISFIPSATARPTPLAVEIRSAAGAPLGSSRPVRDYRGEQPVRVRVPRVPAGERVTVCIENRGRVGIGLIGNAGASARTSTTTVGGRAVDADLVLVFHRDERSDLESVPAMLRHAGVFKGWAGAWTLWLALAAVLLAVPALLARAVRTADADGQVAADERRSRSARIAR